MQSIQAYFLVGSTAVGKSAVAQWIAERFCYDILAADSMQVYRGMDIGTAKPDAGERARARHHGLDLAEPGEFFSAGAYRKQAVSLLTTNASSGRRTIVTGGTGLYVKSLIDGLDPRPEIDSAARARWTNLLEEKGLFAIQEKLRERSPEAYEGLADRQNARRLIRALEMLDSGVDLRNKTWKKGKGFASAPVAGLAMPAEDLKAGIAARVERMYQCGLVEEVRGFLDGGVVLSGTAGQAIGYAEVIDYLNGRCSREDAIARTVVRTRQLAKRQRTWFRRQLNVKWIEITAAMETGEIAQMVLELWRKYGPTEIAG